MECLVLPISVLCMGSRLGYRKLTEGGEFGTADDPVRVVVGKERREFFVEPFVLEENPFRILIEMVRKREVEYDNQLHKKRRVIYVDVDAILFEHMLWLMYNDSSSLFQLNLQEVVDFYDQDY